MKYIALILFMGILGCSGNPVPEGAFEACLDKGKTPAYFSSFGVTKFVCIEDGQEITFK